MQGCVISCGTVVFFQKSHNLSRSLLTNNNFYCVVVDLLPYMATYPWNFLLKMGRFRPKGQRNLKTLWHMGTKRVTLLRPFQYINILSKNCVFLEPIGTPIGLILRFLFLFHVQLKHLTSKRQSFRLFNQLLVRWRRLGAHDNMSLLRINFSV